MRSDAGNPSPPWNAASTTRTTRTYDAGNIYCSFFTRSATTGEIFALILDSNIGGIETSGVDLQVDWAMDAGAGRLEPTCM